MAKQAVAETTETAVSIPPDTIIRGILEAATNPDVDIDKMERLMAMHERLVSNQNEARFTGAMNKAQGEMRRVEADLYNEQTRSKYASYAALDRSLRPIYTVNGFNLSFDTDDSPKDEHVRVVCIVSHDGGHASRRHIDMPADGKGAKGGDVMTKTHATGAAIQYGMRYLLKMIFNVAIGEDDQDGNGPVACITEDQAADIESLIKEVGAEKPRFLKWCKSDSIEEIAVSKYARCVKKLEGMR